ncbi:MAG: hypothetical protein MUO33_09435 [Sedimentisphaerales bacterium]|nr:hypothetical protein [Sedimentisphaerales bacterium]
MTKGCLKVKLDNVEYGQRPFGEVYRMKLKGVIPAFLAAFIVLAMIARSRAVDTRQIEKVFTKQVLDGEDLKIIDQFLGEAVRELVNTRDFAEIAKLRTVILSKQSTQGQYAQQFSESASKHISAGLEQAKQLPQDRQFKVILNLLILIDGLQDARLTDSAIVLLKHSNQAVRYWAVRCVTNPGLVETLDPGGTTSQELAQRIAEQLKELVDTASPEVLGLMAEFAAAVKVPQGEDLLGRIADARMKRYVDWTVEYELLDGTILKLLYGNIAATTPSPAQASDRASKDFPDVAVPATVKQFQSALARRFGQLYSYAMQRYIKGRDVLPEANKHYLTSVLVDVEDKCIGRLLRRPQSTIKKAVEQADYSAVQQEYDKLFGDGTRQGQLVESRFIGTPLTLPEPPSPDPDRD